MTNCEGVFLSARVCIVRVASPGIKFIVGISPSIFVLCQHWFASKKRPEVDAGPDAPWPEPPSDYTAVQQWDASHRHSCRLCAAGKARNSTRGSRFRQEFLANRFAFLAP